LPLERLGAAGHGERRPKGRRLSCGYLPCPLLFAMYPTLSSIHYVKVRAHVRPEEAAGERTESVSRQGS
jgi:hypothetical protein